MNADRLIRVAINMLMRHGLRRLSKGGKSGPETRRAGQAAKLAGRIRRK